MANDTVGRLNVALDMRLNALEAQIAQANKKVATMSKRMHSDVAQAAKKMNAALSTLGVGLSVGALVAFTKSVINMGSKISDLAIQSDVSTQTLQALGVVAMDAGIDMDTLARSFTQMRKSIGEASDGVKTYTDAFGKLNINIEALKKLSTEQQFEIIARSIVNATDQASAFGAAMDILGTKNAPKLKEVLDKLGKEGIASIVNEMKDFGLSDEQIATLDKAGDKLERMAKFAQVIAASGFMKLYDALAKSPIPNTEGLDMFYRPKDKPADERFIWEGPKVAGGADGSGRAIPIDYRAENDAAAAYAAGLQKQTEAAEQLSRIESARAKGLDLLSVSQAENANEIERTWMAMSETKDIGLSLENVRPFDASTASLDRLSEKTLEQAEAYKDLANPARKYERIIADINYKHRQGAIDAETAAAAIKKVTEEMEEATKKGQTATEYATQQMTAMWQNVADRAAQSFADMVLEGEFSMKSLSDIVARAVIEMAAKLALINPILNLVFGGTSGWEKLPALFDFGGGKAVGGPVDSGTTYLVGEEGPELFTPSSSGMITPNDKLASIGTSGGYQINITQTFTGGVTERDLGIWAVRVKEETTKGIVDGISRGGAMRKAFNR